MFDVKVIDLRSDTITKPPPEMIEAMCQAEVGDDVYGEDPTVKDLEQLGATMFGKEAALYLPSGTMGNLVGVMAHCWERGSEILLGDKSHIYLLEQGNASQIGSIHTRALKNEENGTIDLLELRNKVRLHDDYLMGSLYSVSSLVCLENTHNLCNGAVLQPAYVKQVSSIVKEFNMKLHFDGARILNAAVALGQPVDEIVRDVDSVSVCLSKGLCCPMGTLLLGNRDFILKAHRVRKAIGGGLRQSGYMAATGIYALKNLVNRLADDHEYAYRIASTINRQESKFVKVDASKVQTNIVFIELECIKVSDFCERLMQVTTEERAHLGSEICKIRMLAFSKSTVRFLTSAVINEDLAELVIKKLVYLINVIDKRGPAAIFQ